MKQHRLVWTEEWTTRIVWLDDEHRDLVGYYHAVVDALRDDDVDVFLARLRDLRKWLGRHFKNEEAALQRISCRAQVEGRARAACAEAERCPVQEVWRCGQQLGE